MALWIIVLRGVWRFVSGRRLRGEEKTDATFFRPARLARGGWWASSPRVVRAAVRLVPFALLWGWVTHRTVTALVVVAVGAWLVWLGVRNWRAYRHEVRVLRPIWPAVAGIIGVPVQEPATAWLDVPVDMVDPDAEIVVGLRAADADDERRVDQLVTLFDQRFGARHIGAIDYARRLVHLRLRPAEPEIWPAVAEILGVRDSAPAGDWLTVPADPDADNAQVTVRLPDDVIDDRRITAALDTLVNQRFRGTWEARVDRPRRRVTVTRKRPDPVPPVLVDFLAEHPEFVDFRQQGVNGHD